MTRSNDRLALWGASNEHHSQADFCGKRGSSTAATKFAEGQVSFPRPQGSPDWPTILGAAPLFLAPRRCLLFSP